MIGLFSASGDGEFGRSRSAPKSAPRSVGRLRGPLPLALLAHDLSVNVSVVFVGNVCTVLGKFSFT